MKKEEHPPSRENALCKFALSQGALALSQGAYPYSKSKDTTIVRITKGFFGFGGKIPGQAGNDVGEIPGQARNEGRGHRPALRRAQGPAEKAQAAPKRSFSRAADLTSY